MAGEGYIGAGGQKFMSSVLAKASQPGGYTRTTYYPGGNPFYAGPKQAAGSSLSSAARLAYGKAIEQYQPSGAYGKGIEAALKRGRTKAVAGGQQALVSAGLAGTSMMAAPSQRFEEEIAMPTRAQVEETRAGRLSELYAMLAGAEQQGYEAMMGDSGYGVQTIPRYREPAATESYGGYGKIPAPNFTLPVSNRIASALSNVQQKPITFAEPFWGESEEWRAAQPEWVTGTANFNLPGQTKIPAGTFSGGGGGKFGGYGYTGGW